MTARAKKKTVARVKQIKKKKPRVKRKIVDRPVTIRRPRTDTRPERIPKVDAPAPPTAKQPPSVRNPPVSKPKRNANSRSERAKLSKAAYMSLDEAAAYVGSDYVIDRDLSNRNRIAFAHGDKLTLAFRGTDPKNWQDLGTDVLLGLGIVGQSARFQNSLEVARAAVAKYGRENVHVTGHSLGGSQALYVNQMLDVSASAFNPGAAPWQGQSDYGYLARGRKDKKNKADIYLTGIGDLISHPHTFSKQDTVRTVKPKVRGDAHTIDNFI